MAERLSEGTVVLVIGVAIVFMVLVLLWAILLAFSKMFGNSSNKAKTKAPVKKAEASVVKNTAPATNQAVEDEDEIVAVITAAISAITGTDGSKFKIKSIKRISNWNK